MDYSTTTSILVIYCYIFHPWTRQRFSWECVIGGMACHISKVVASNYGFQASDEIERQRQLRQHVAAELFYVFGPCGSETCLVQQKQKHLYSKASDAYAAKMLAKMIWQEESDKEMLPTSKQVATFMYKLGQLTNRNPNTRAILSNAIAMLTSNQIRIQLPTQCFRTRL